MSNQYGLKEVLNGTGYDFATGLPLWYFDYAEMTEIDNAGARLDISGGQGNYRLLSFDHTKTSTMKVKLPLVDLNLLSSLMGDTVAIGAQTLLQRELQTIVSATATLAATPVGAAPSVYFLSGSRDNGTLLTKVASAPTAGQFSITAGVLTFNAADEGKKVVVYYSYSAPATTTKFSMKANKFVTPIKLVGQGIARDQVTGQDKISIITVYNARFKQNFNLTMSSTAATSLDLELDMYSVLQNNGDQVYYDVVFLT